MNSAINVTMYEILSRVGKESSEASIPIDAKIEFMYGINFIRIALPLTQVVIKMRTGGANSDPCCDEYGTYLRRTATSMVSPAELGKAVEEEVNLTERICEGVRNGMRRDGWFAPRSPARNRAKVAI
jgi:hypothetical protein